MLAVGGDVEGMRNSPDMRWRLQGQDSDADCCWQLVLVDEKMQEGDRSMQDCNG
jgi:hypothetical protein